MRVRFNDLPLSARERFAGLRRGGDPALLRAYREDTGVVLWLSGIVFVGALIALGVTLTQCGDWSTRVPHELYWGMSAALFVVLLTLLGLLGSRLWRPPPYPVGRYLFAGCIVETQGDALDIHLATEITGLVLEHHTRRGRAYTNHYLAFLVGNHTRCPFPVSGEAEAVAVRQRWEQARAALGDAWARRDRAALAALDPFHECSVTGQWSTGVAPTSGPRCTPRPRWWGPLRLLTSVVVALGVPFLMYQTKHAELAPPAYHAPAPARTAAAVATRYQAKAGSEAAARFVAAALEQNEHAGRKPVCVSVYGVDEAAWKKVDADIARLPAARGKTVSTFAGSWSFFNGSFGVVEALDATLAEGVGPGALPAKTPGLDDNGKNCPYVLVRSEPRAGAELYAIRDRFCAGLFGARFTVATLLPGKAEEPAFELVVPAPTKRELDAYAGGPRGEVNAHNARYLYDKLKARLRQHFLR